MKKLLAILVACLMPICLIAGSGDVNGDGVVSMADIDAIIGYIMKTSPSVSKEAADVNMDGSVDVADLVSLNTIINQPIIVKDDIGKWSEIRAFADGSLIAIKNMANVDSPEEVIMILPSEELGIMYSYIKFDENSMPQYITINENTIIVDSYYDNLVDLTVVYENTTANMFNGLSFNPSGVSKTRTWSENNGARNATAIVEIVSGMAGVGIGAAFITGSLIAEVGSGGASTPISIPGILAGTTTIAGGLSTFRTGWNKIFMPDSQGSNITGTVGGQIFSTLSSNFPNYAYDNGAIPEKYAGYLRDPNYANTLNKLGWINFFVGLTAGIADNLYGRTVTWDDQRNFYYQKDGNGNGKVVTGLCKDITLNSATVRGYISPSITVSQLDGSSLENEYGIVVVSASDQNDRHIQKNSGSGGLIEFTFNNLKPNTVYNYRTYYLDKTNVISLLGEINTFQTEQYSLPTISDFKVTKSQYSEGAFSNNGKTYDYCFNASVTISFPLADRENVEDWGYVYKDPYGKTKKISTTTTNAEFVDNRYAYYRNQPISTACLYTYVKFIGMDEIIYGDPAEYDLIYAFKSCPDNNHPHWIDLGLPSGTKWRCCNEGASTPEEYGGYYEFGQVASAPSKDQIKELLDHTTSVWTTQNGVNGTKFTGSNGGTIFLPAAGSLHCCYLGFSRVGSGGYYWSSSPDSEYVGWELYSYSYGAGWHICTHAFLLSVRPVR